MVKFIRVYKECGSLCVQDLYVTGDILADLPTIRQYGLLHNMYCFADYDKRKWELGLINPVPSVILPSLPLVIHTLNSGGPEESNRLLVVWGLYAQRCEVTSAHPHLGGVVTVSAARLALEDLFDQGKAHRRRVTAGATARYAIGDGPSPSTVVRPLWRLTENYRRQLDGLLREMI